MSSSEALVFNIISKCNTTKARTSRMKLPNFEVDLPIFMPVGTQGTMKGLTPEQLIGVDAQIILGNTYHLGTRPGREILDQFGGLHKFMNWERALLTDSGGFQMVSLLKLAQITEEGVKFQSPYDGSECMLTPEESIQIQNSIGADIMMQLDDVVDVKETEYARFKLATERTTRWYDRCVKANKNPHKQNLFAIVQGGLFPDLRKQSLRELIERNASGYAIGGLSGGEDKNKFWSVVSMCTDELPERKPRYCMGVGFPVDLVVCCALGVDMFDCVYPTRTARFGCALVDGGQINLKNSDYKFDFTPIDAKCACPTCKTYTKAYIRTIVTRETVGCHLISVHNIFYLMQLMKKIRGSLKEGTFPEFVRQYLSDYYKDKEYPKWVVDALNDVNIPLKEKDIKIQNENALWNEEEGERDYMERVSGFRQSNFDLGYQAGVLDDYDEAERGRISGYFSASRNDQRLIGETNPVRRISGLHGCLSACLTTKSKDIGDESRQKLNSLIKSIEDILERISNLTLGDASNSQSKLDNSCCTLYPNDLKTTVEEIFNDSRDICSKLNWIIPPLLK